MVVPGIPLAPVCIAPCVPAHAVVVALEDGLLEAEGLTPGVASSVAPSGIPVTPTEAPGPIPSGEVTPSEAGAPVTMPTCANAGLPHSNASANAVINNRFIEVSPTWPITPRDDREAP
jgi:hypothetical protein